VGIEDSLPAEGFITTTVESVIGWFRQASFWPATMGLACCAIEMMAFGAPRFDAGRWGQEIFRASPRQADVLIVSGRVSQKMAPIVRQVYDQMPNPKWVISMGACASSGGLFNNYAVVQGCDHIVPVDIFIPGCPPRPDMLIDAMFKLKKGQGLNLAADDPARARMPVLHYPTGKRRAKLEEQIEREQLVAPATIEQKGLMR
jgi:NADH-quinone oxidoreductase subunit B